METSEVLNVNKDAYNANLMSNYGALREAYRSFHQIIIKHEAGTLDYTPKASLEVLKQIASHVGQALYWLEVHGEIEGENLRELYGE